MPRLSPIVRLLLWINIGSFAAQVLLWINLPDMLGLRCILSPHFSPYQLFTHLFVHASFSHLFSNMLSLLTFGSVLEYELTSRRFITFYIITGLGAAVLYSIIHYIEIRSLYELCQAYMANPNPESFATYLGRFSHDTYRTFYYFTTDFFTAAQDPAYIAKSKSIVSQLYMLKADVPVVGASGAIFGILMAFAMLHPNTELLLIFFPIPIKAKYFVALYGAYELYAGIQANPVDNVAHFAHLGGIMFAYFLIKWWKVRH